MAFYIAGTVVDQNQVPVVGADVYVYADGVLATLEDENGNAVTNPFKSIADGFYEAYSTSFGTHILEFWWGGKLRTTKEFFDPEQMTDFAAASIAVSSAGSAANSAAAARESELATQALADAASNPDSNTAAALAASQNALDALAELNGTFAPEATSVNANVLACTGKIVLWSADDHQYRVSLFNRAATVLQWDVFDEDLDIPDQVGFFQLNSPDYSASGANLPDRIGFTPTDRLPTLPPDDPDGANFSGLQGYIELSDANKSAIAALANQTLQPANYVEGGINPLNIYTRLSIPAKPRDPRLWQYRQKIEVGSGSSRDFTTPGAAVRSLYNATDTASFTSNPLRVDIQPFAITASPMDPIAIVLDPGDYEDVNLHMPDWVSLIARYPNTVTFKHSAGATRPILQAHLNHQLVDILWENTVPEGTDYGTNPTTSSARYAVHRDYFHLFQNVNAAGDYQRNALLQIIGGSLTVGSAAGIQAFGCGLPVGDTVEFLDLDLGCNNGSYVGILAACNNSSNTFGGGRWSLRNVRDISGRASNVSTIGVQVKQGNTHPNELILEGVKNFDQINLSGTTAGNWVLKGNWTGAINDTIPGGDSGFTDY